MLYHLCLLIFLQFEDFSDESFEQRHLRCEAQERQKFSSYLQMARRGRGSRTDSGTVTPDPTAESATTSDATLTSKVSAVPAMPSASGSQLDGQDEISRSASFFITG